MDRLIYAANPEVIHIDAIRRSNAQLRDSADLVVVFIGGTGGIGESTARELFRNTIRPKAYIVGRNEASGRKVCETLHELNDQGTAVFLQRDISTLRSCDELCAELRRREPKIHCLFLTAGYMTLSGRAETVEGLDGKMCVNYYSRIRCTINLMPLLTAAADAGELSRVISVLAAGSEGDVRLEDLDLREGNYTLHACLAHCVLMTDFIMEELSKRYPSTSFSHSYPGTIKTGIANSLSGPVRLAVKVLYAIMSPWILNVGESGERHLFQMTSQCYPAAQSSIGVPVIDSLSVFPGSNGITGSGAYLLDWDGKPVGDESYLTKYREMDVGARIWEHTMQMFREAEQRMRSRMKRPAEEEEAEGSGRSIPNPIGWRPAT